MSWIFDNIRFPYPNMQQLNLDWIMDRLSNLPSIDYPIPVDDGGSGERTKLAALNSFGVSQFIDRDEIRAAYKKDIADTLASYFTVFQNNLCLDGTPKVIDGTKPVPAYSGDKGWTQLLTTFPTRFDFDDTVSLYGNTCNVLFSDCTSWAMLITSCKKYEESPYYFAFSDLPTPDMDTLTDAAVDSNMRKPWSIDFLNKWIGLSGILYSSGGKGYRIFRKTLTSEEMNEDAINHLETGDLIFFGANDPQFDARYFYIHHCGIFIKDLEELNSSSYISAGQRIRAIDLNGNEVKSSKGYVAHCAGGILGTTYNSAIRIQTLDDMLLYDNPRLVNNTDPTTEICVYACRPVQSVMNSSKLFNAATGLLPMFDYIIGKAQQVNNDDAVILDLYHGRFYPIPFADITDKGLTAKIKNVGGLIDLTITGTLTETVSAGATALSGLPIPISSPIMVVGNGGYTWEIDANGDIKPTSSKASGTTVSIHATYVKAI